MHILLWFEFVWYLSKAHSETDNKDLKTTEFFFFFASVVLNRLLSHEDGGCERKISDKFKS